MTLDETLRILRFIHQIPEEEWYGIHGLPKYVFEYIYNGTFFLDSPWVNLIEDEWGQKIMKVYRGTPWEQGRMIEDSPLWRHAKHLDYWVRRVQGKETHIIDFEHHFYFSKNKRFYWGYAKS